MNINSFLEYVYHFIREVTTKHICFIIKSHTNKMISSLAVAMFYKMFEIF